MSAPPRYRELEEEIETVRADKEAAIEAQEFEKAASLRDKERKLSQKKKELEERWRNEADEEQPEIGEDEIADIVSMWTGIPVFKLTEAESQKLVRMEEELHKRVIGQEAAIVAVSKAIRRARAGIKDPKRPTGSFIFLGPSGVGKTELARTLAEFLFGDEDAMIQVDMSEYMEKHSVSRLVGSPPGYVGYDEGGQLTEAVRRKPYSVLLLDEIEKAHPDVFNILLQILEDGKLTDAQGRKVDFRNTIVIMTSNIGAAQISKNQSLGFAIGDEQGLSYDDMKSRVMGELKKVFRPELLNRIDEIIVFHKLEKSEILQIVDLMMKRLRDQMSVHGATVELTQEAKELLVEEGYDPAMGARPLRRAIQRLIEDPLADFVLGRELGGRLDDRRRPSRGSRPGRPQGRDARDRGRGRSPSRSPCRPRRRDADGRRRAKSRQSPRCPTVESGTGVPPRDEWGKPYARPVAHVHIVRHRRRDRRERQEDDRVTTATAPRYRHALPQLTHVPFLTDGGHRDDADLPRGPRPPALRGVRPAHPRRRGGGAAALLRAVRPDRARPRGRDRARDADVARQPRLGGAARALARAAGRPQPRAPSRCSSELRDEHETGRDADRRSPAASARAATATSSASAMSADEAAAYHAHADPHVRRAGADLVTALTMTYADEAVGIVQAARGAALPVVISFTVETDGRLPSGQPLGEAIEEVDAGTDGAAAYFMVNCAHPSHFYDVLEPGAAWTSRIRGVRANASRLSHAELDEAEELDTGNPEELAIEYVALRERLPSLTVLGGCCGTDHRHVDAMCAAGSRTERSVRSSRTPRATL